MGLYLRQLLAGRDFAEGDLFAGQMANFIYLIGDDVSRECMVVDPAWDIKGICDYVEREGMRLTGALVTHYHPDHIGLICPHEPAAGRAFVGNLPQAASWRTALVQSEAPTGRAPPGCGGPGRWRLSRDIGDNMEHCDILCFHQESPYSGKIPPLARSVYPG